MISKPNKELCPREKTELFYDILAGGARLKLLESVMYLHLPELFVNENTLTLEQIIEKLHLSPIRAKKWLYLLSTEDFLIENKLEAQNTYSYSLGPVLKALFDNGKEWSDYIELVDSWRSVSFEDISSMLQGANVTYDVSMPAKTPAETAYLQNWMAESSKPVIKLLNQHLPLDNTKKILDVGGGDGTIACALAKTHPSIQFTVYNLPLAIELAKNVVANNQLNDRVDLLVGNFLVDDSFPKGYDIILINRVLNDWPDDVCKKVFKMAFEALEVGGYLVICEEFKDFNQNMVLTWEFRYMYWDNYDRALFKPAEVYHKLLSEVGFSNYELTDVDNDQLYRVIKVKK